MTLQERWSQEINLKPCKITIRKEKKEKKTNDMQSRSATSGGKF